MVSPFEGLAALRDPSTAFEYEDGMLDALVSNLIGSLADIIASTATTMADDHQKRRDKLADYKAKADQHVGQLLTGVVAELHPAVRNRYQDWLAHPRLGHEPAAAELQNAEIGLNEAVMALKANPSLLNHAFAIGASIRLTAISEALGVACIYHDASKRLTPVKAKRAPKPIRANDKRLNRRVPVIDDVPDALRPIVARLGAGHPRRAKSIEELEAHRGGVLDSDGIATRLAALVAHADHQAFVETLAAQAAASKHPEEAALAATDKVATEPGSSPPATSAPKLPTRGVPVAVVPVAAEPATAIASVPRATGEIDADIGAVTSFVARYRWAVIEEAGRYSLEKLDKRADINRAFDRVADLPAMQEALGLVHASHRTTKS